MRQSKGLSVARIDLHNKFTVLLRHPRKVLTYLAANAPSPLFFRYYKQVKFVANGNKRAAVKNFNVSRLFQRCPKGIRRGKTSILLQVLFYRLPDVIGQLHQVTSRPLARMLMALAVPAMVEMNPLGASAEPTSSGNV